MAPNRRHELNEIFDGEFDTANVVVVAGAAETGDGEAVVADADSVGTIAGDVDVGDGTVDETVAAAPAVESTVSAAGTDVDGAAIGFFFAVDVGETVVPGVGGAVDETVTAVAGGGTVDETVAAAPAEAVESTGSAADTVTGADSDVTSRGDSLPLFATTPTSTTNATPATDDSTAGRRRNGPLGSALRSTCTPAATESKMRERNDAGAA